MNIISHPKEGKFKEKLLTEHLSNVAERSKSLVEKMDLGLTMISKEKLTKLVYLIGLFHDFGKFTEYFQDYIRRDDKSNQSSKEKHGLISAMAIYLILRENKFNNIWCGMAYLIVKHHHGNLDDIKLPDNVGFINEQIESIQNFALRDAGDFYSRTCGVRVEKTLKDLRNYKALFDNVDESFENNENSELFFITNLLYSLLIDNDKKDAARLTDDYFDGNLQEKVFDIQKYLESLKKENLSKFDPDTPINRERNLFFNQIINHTDIKAENHFYEITAPTGIGKTFGALAFAQTLKSKLPKGQGRIIYCLPYTSIIDQNYDEFEKVIRFTLKEKYDEKPSRYLLKHHHLAEMEIKGRVDEEEYNYKDYLDDRLFVESWESAVVVTTFVQFFHSIIGNKNRMLKKFHNIIGSIVILDEVQNIPEKYHFLLRHVLKILGETFNIYFLLLTATQPNILEENLAVKIVKAEDFMQKDIFNRVKLQNNNEQEKTIEQCAEELEKSFSGENALLVLNTKKSTYQLFSLLKHNEKFNTYQLFCLTTLLTPYDRKKLINKIKKGLEKKQKIIVVSTQLVEAGVDISFQTVYRDFGPLDSVVQVAGRCNRNGEYGQAGGKMRLIQLKDESKSFYSYVYSSVIAQWTKETLDKGSYESKDFSSLASAYFKKFDSKGTSEDLLDSIKELNYSKIENFKLIEDNYSIYDIYILENKVAEEKMNELHELISAIQTEETKTTHFSTQRLKLEKLKKQLTHYKISLNNNEHEKIKDYVENDNNIKNSFYPYISLENTKTVYSCESGLKIFEEDIQFEKIDFF